MKPSFDDLAFLFRQLTMAAQAQLPFREVFSMQREEKPAGQPLAVLRRHVESGARLSDALDAGQLVSAETADLVRVAEGNALLPEVLDALATDYARRAATRRTLLKAVYWPATLAVALLLLLLITTIFVVPAFRSVYEDFGADLPAVTSMVSHWPWAALVLAAAVLLTLLGRAFLPVPFIDSFRERIFQLRLAGLLALAAAAGGRCANAALAHLHATAPTRRAARSVDALAGRVSAGADLLQAMRETAFVPARVAAMLELGSKTSNIAGARAYIESWCAAELDEVVPRFEAEILIVTYIVIGVVLANVVIALYLPVFRLGSVV